MSPELQNMLIQVITSWQVIAITIVVVIYFFLVGRVSSFTRRKKIAAPQKKVKTKKTRAPVPVPSEGEDLGVQEEK